MFHIGFLFVMSACFAISVGALVSARGKDKIETIFIKIVMSGVFADSALTLLREFLHETPKTRAVLGVFGSLLAGFVMGSLVCLEVYKRKR